MMTSIPQAFLRTPAPRERSFQLSIRWTSLVEVPAADDYRTVPEAPQAHKRRRVDCVLRRLGKRHPKHRRHVRECAWPDGDAEDKAENKGGGHALSRYADLPGP